MDKLLEKVNRILDKDYTHRTLLETIEALAKKVDEFEEENGLMAEKHAERDIQFNEFVRIIEQYKFSEALLLERLKKQTLQIKEMQQDRRLTRYWDMAEENLRLAQELAILKGELSG